jgi:hypothetical protein
MVVGLGPGTKSSGSSAVLLAVEGLGGRQEGQRVRTASKRLRRGSEWHEAAGWCERLDVAGRGECSGMSCGRVAVS